jgi:hypothetical protein
MKKGTTDVLEGRGMMVYQDGQMAMGYLIGEKDEGMERVLLENGE